MLLTDAAGPEVGEAVSLLDGWRAVVVPPAELARAVAAAGSVSAVLVATSNPNALRDVVEAARRRAAPVIVGCPDDAVRQSDNRQRRHRRNHHRGFARG